jgi:lysophospholipase L1-like esterase
MTLSGRNRLSWILARLGLALGALLVTLMLLEAAARNLAPDPAPRHLRDGIYVNSLPLVTGLSPLGFPEMVTDVRLPTAKSPGEYRVFVYGESSIEGRPRDQHSSAATLLHDMLVKEHAGRQITVANMGRTGSISANVFYYLLESRRFRPDAIIFYFGMNDNARLPGESCAPLLSPRFHGAWRQLVRHSGLFRYVRMYVPQLLWKGQTVQEEGSYCAGDSFALWADILVELASEIAPVVIVTSPVLSVLSAVEADHRDLQWQAMDLEYRDLVHCYLSPGCSFEEHFAHLTRPPEHSLGSVLRQVVAGRPRSLHEYAAERRTDVVKTVEGKARIWREATARHGALFVEFHRSLASVSAFGLWGLTRGFLSDEIHLTVRGNQFLAAHWAEALRPVLSGVSGREPALPRFGEALDYVNASVPVYSMPFNYIRRGWLISALPLFEEELAYPVEEARKTMARLMLGWTRRGAGLDADMPASLDSCLGWFDPLNFDNAYLELDQLNRHCGVSKP